MNRDIHEKAKYTVLGMLKLHILGQCIFVHVHHSPENIVTCSKGVLNEH